MDLKEKIHAAGFATQKEFSEFCMHKSDKTLYNWKKRGAPKIAHRYLDERIEEIKRARRTLNKYGVGL